jgi:hypothetical protein
MISTYTAVLNIYNFACTGSLSPTSAFAFSLMIFRRILPDFVSLAGTARSKEGYKHTGFFGIASTNPMPPTNHLYLLVLSLNHL